MTAEYLFDPHGQGELFTKDDDHMAQIIELLGDFPLEAKMGGKYSRELFDHTGSVIYFPRCSAKLNVSNARWTTIYTHAEAVASQACHN